MRILALILILAGCAKSSSNGGEVKSTFSAWSQDSAGVVIDLSHGVGTASGSISNAGAIICTCTFAVAGDHLQGTLDVSACSGSGTCSPYEGAFTYTYAADQTLSVCRTSDSSCLKYH